MTGLLSRYLGYGDVADRPADMTGLVVEGVLAVYWAEDESKLYWWNWSTTDWEQITPGEAPSGSGVRYVRVDGDWEADPLQDDAPEDGTNYGRKDGAWVGIAEFPEAPNNGNTYARRNEAWEAVTILTNEQVQDIVGALVVQGTGITVTYDDGANTLTIACSITQYTNAMADARIAAASINDLADVNVGTPSNGDVLTWDTDHWEAAAPTGGGGGPVAYRVAYGFTTPPTADEVLLLHTFAEAVTFPDDFSGSVGDCETNPASTFTIDVEKNGSSVGTISISNSGVVTFVTSGGSVSFAVGDKMKWIAQSGVDTAANVSVTLLGELD